MVTQGSGRGRLDAWTNPFAYVGRRTTGNAAQRTLIHGPGWHGAVPDGITHVIAAPGADVWLTTSRSVGPSRRCVCVNWFTQRSGEARSSDA